MNFKFYLLLIGLCAAVTLSAQLSYPGNIKVLDNSCFTEGFVIRIGDAIPYKIYLPKHEMSDDLYLYIIAKDIKDSIYVFTPKDIDGYSVRDISMTSHRSVTTSDTSYFFIKLIEQGPVNLYQRVAIPADNEFLYYLKKSEAKDLLFFAPYKQNYLYIQERFKDGDMVSRYNSQNEDQFRAVFSEYLKDCVGVSNKIITKFYSMKDLEIIIKEYNICMMR